MSKMVAVVFLFLIGLAVSGCGLRSREIFGEAISLDRLDLDQQLRDLIEEQGITRLDPGPEPEPGLAALGQALFFDKVLSGNRDISCATCHHPTFSVGDALPVAIGTGGTGQGDRRTLGRDRSFIPRNSPEVFNRGRLSGKACFGTVALPLAQMGNS